MKKFLFFVFLFFVLNSYAYSIKLYYDNYAFNKLKNFDIISMKSTFYSDLPKNPMLPVKTVNIVIPYGKEYEKISIKSESTLLEGKYNILPVPENIPTNKKLTKNFSKSSVYTKNEFFPDKCYKIKGIYHKNGVSILTILIYPFQYNPVTKKIKHNKTINLTVNFKNSEYNQVYVNKILKPEFLEKIFDKKNFLNKTALQTYFNKNNRMYSPKSSIVSSDNPYDYIIITNGALEPYFQTLLSHKLNLGLNAAIFTTEDIYANYSGIDNQEKIRNFIIDAYSLWASTEHPLQWILLGGDSNIIPARTVKVYAYWSSAWNNRTFACDSYYVGLDGNWDNDGDGIYGEGDDSQKPDDLTDNLGLNGDEADWLYEISVGRASLEDSTEVNNWITKTIAYENANISSNQYLRTSTLIGEYLGYDTWGGDYMNEIALFQPQFDKNKLYQSEGTYSKDNVIDAINNGTNIISHIGHGNYLKVCNIYDGDVDTLLTNTNYCLFYTQACNTGHFNGYSCIAESFIEKEHGAYAFIGNTHYGFYSTFQQQGSSQLFQREFYDAIENEGIKKLGDANNDSKEDLVGIIGATGSYRFSALDITLFGDPNLELYTQVDNVSAQQISETEIKLTYSDTPESGFDNISNYSIYQRDNSTQTVTISSISTNGNIVYLYTSQQLEEGIPYNVLISNVSGIKNPTERPIKSIYNIVELSIIKPTVWSANEGPYYVYKNLVVNGSNLTINPGTLVKVYDGQFIVAYNNGYIKALGDSTNKVIFTSYKDTASASKGDWDQIFIYRDANSDSCIFENCIIDYATTGIYLDSLTTVTIKNTIIRNCAETGLRSYYASPNISQTAVTNCENGFYFENSQLNISNIISYENQDYGIYLKDNSDIQIKNSIIRANGLNDYFNDSSILQITYSDLENPYSGAGNFSANPMFDNTVTFVLSPFSPCIDAGDPSEFDPDGTVKDLGMNYFYQTSVLSTPQITEISVSDSLRLNWENVSGAIYYNIYSSENPYSNFTIKKSMIRALSWSDSLNTTKRFYKITAGNNRD